MAVRVPAARGLLPVSRPRAATAAAAALRPDPGPGRCPRFSGPDSGGGGGLACAAHHGEHAGSLGDGGPGRIRELGDVLVVVLQSAAGWRFNSFKKRFGPFFWLFQGYVQYSAKR